MDRALVAILQGSARPAGIGTGGLVSARGIPEGRNSARGAGVRHAGAPGGGMHRERVTPAGLQLWLGAVLTMLACCPAQLPRGSWCLEAAVVSVCFPPPPDPGAAAGHPPMFLTSPVPVERWPIRQQGRERGGL